MSLSKREIESMATETLREVRALSVKNTPAIRSLRRELSKKLRAEPAATVLAVGEALIDRGLRWVGYELITNHREALASLRLKRVESLGHGIDSWAAVDTFAIYISGPTWRDRQIADKDVIRWSKSQDRWWRRVALVSTVALNSKSTGGDVRRTLKIATLLIDDRDDMVVKALSWSLRSLAPLQPMAVRRYLDRYGPRVAARVKREVTSKLDTGLKQVKRNSREATKVA